MPVGNQVREKLRKLKLTRGFPSQAVMQECKQSIFILPRHFVSY